MIPTLYEPFRHWSEGDLYNVEKYREDCKHINLAANVCGFTPVNLGKLIKNGVLSDIEGIHRKIIDRATERKAAGMSMKDYDMRLEKLTELMSKFEVKPRDPERSRENYRRVG